MSTQTNQQETNVKTSLGQFYVSLRDMENNKTEHTIQPLSQDDFARGWRMILPKYRKDSTIHHFSVYLSQLPPHLWSKITETQTGDRYYTIHDNIYDYSIKKSEHDTMVYKLGQLVKQRYPSKVEIARLYNYLNEHRIKGWVMIRAKRILRI